MPLYYEYRAPPGQLPGGHYSVHQTSGTIAATISAGGHLARLWWRDNTKKLVLLGCDAAATINGAVTAAVAFGFKLVRFTGCSVDFGTAVTISNLTSKQNLMRTEMPPSLMGTIGPAICTTTVMSGQTLTADTLAFACSKAPIIMPVTATGTAVALPVGASTGMLQVYRPPEGMHPIQFGQNEGCILQLAQTGPADGTFTVDVLWHWAEVSGI